MHYSRIACFIINNFHLSVLTLVVIPVQCPLITQVRLSRCRKTTWPMIWSLVITPGKQRVKSRKSHSITSKQREESAGSLDRGSHFFQYWGNITNHSQCAIIGVNDYHVSHKTVFAWTNLIWCKEPLHAD